MVNFVDQDHEIFQT